MTAGFVAFPAFFLLSFAGLQAQSPAFEVASIRVDKSGVNSSHWHDQNVRMTATNVSLRKLIAFAYQLHDFQISGPDWLASERFDIEAEGPEWGKRDQRPMIMQNLLVERFKLAVHRTTKELPVYSLTIAKNGPKLQRVTADGSSGVSSSRGRLTLQKAAMKEIVDSISRQLDRPVIDSTGLSGAFNGELQWTPDDDTANAEPGSSVSSDAGPSIFTALQEQFGLKLVAQRGPVEVLVIDQIEKLPTEN